MALLSCLVCGRRFDPALVRSRPFCSERCRQIDLGRWLSEKYSLPELGTDAEEDEGDRPPEGSIRDDSPQES